jgi:hypothetical protein
METLGEAIVIDCLRAEFSLEDMESHWRRQYPRQTSDMAKWMGLTSAETLALWFGADDVRTPTGKTFSALYNAASSGAGNSAAKFVDDHYPRIIAAFASRRHYDLTLPDDRLRVIFGRQPYREQSKRKSTRSMIAPRDFAFLTEVVTEDDGGEQTANMEEGAGGEVETEDEGGEQTANMEKGAGGEVEMEDEGRNQTANMEKGAGGEVEMEDDGGDQTANMEEGASGEVETEDDDGEQTANMEKGTCGEVEMEDDGGDQTANMEKGASGEVETEDDDGEQNASSIEHGRPKSIARDLACTPPSQRIQTPFEEDDSFYFPPLGNDGHISTPGDIYSATPGSKRGESTDSHRSEGKRRRTSPQSNVESSESGTAIGSTWTDRQFSKMASDTEWLDDIIVDSFMELFAFSRPDYTHVSTLKLKYMMEKNDVLGLRFHSSLESMLGPKMAFCMLNPGDCHWVFATVALADNQARLFDSLPSPGTVASTAQLLANLRPILPQCETEIEITSVDCCRQSDGHNCGVHALVNAWFTADDQQPPQTLEARLWRRVFLAMARRHSLMSSLPDQTAVEVNSRVHDSMTEEEEDQELSLRRGMSPLAKRQWHIQQAASLSKACIETYTRRLEVSRGYLAWTKTQVAPAVESLTQSASEEIQRLGHLLKQFEAESNTYQRVIDAAKLAVLWPAGDLNEMAQGRLETITKTRQYYELRYNTCKLAVDACRALDVDGLVLALESTIRGYEDLIRRIE